MRKMIPDMMPSVKNPSAKNQSVRFGRPAATKKIQVFITKGKKK